MHPRIRGHYRITESGVIVSLRSENETGITYATPPTALPFALPASASPSKAATIELAVITCVVSILIGLVLLVVPRVRAASIAAQAVAGRGTATVTHPQTRSPTMLPTAP